MSAKMNSQSNSSWGGRFASGPAAETAAYTESQQYDRAMYAEDIRASQAHAKMLGDQHILPAEDVNRILDGLDKVREEIETGQFRWRRDLEDVHMNIEARLTEIVGDAGKKLHTGRSRNDQVGLSWRMYVARCCEDWTKLLARLCGSLRQLAGDHQDTIMPGFTHLQPAQPVVLAHHLLAYAYMFRRDADRLGDTLKRVRISPLGAAAMAGSTYDLNPLQVAAEVGFPHIYANSMDAVSDRDFVLEALFAASVIAMHLSRLCEEIIIWSTPAFGFIRLPDAYATGSSIMPQKKNPDVAELMRGRTGRVYGNLTAMLVTMKSLPLAYNRDMQEDKEGFLDTNETIVAALGIMTHMLPEISFQRDRMAEACRKGFLNATELADYLAAKGVPFREAHHITGRAVAAAEKLGLGLEELPLESMREIDPRIDGDVRDVLEYRACIKRRETPGGTGPESVKRQLADFDKWLAEMKAHAAGE